MKKVVVAIDFGTSGTTYAFAFTDKKDNIKVGKWEIIEEKNPTEIILDECLEVIKFGAECKDYLGDKSSSDDTFYYFKNIKMALYNNQKEINSDNGGTKHPLAFIISKILSKIKEHAINAIKAINPTILESEIDWKVTVPAIWNNESKDTMRKACELAKIFNKNKTSTFFALEPEAAACDYVINHPNSNAIIQGNAYIVCDIGGGTIDISTHKRIEEEDGNIYIEELYPPIGGNNGSTYINKKFMEEVIKKLFGREAYDRLMKAINDPYERLEIYADYCDFLESIEEFKTKISADKFNKKESRNINCHIFKEFLDKNEKIDNLIEKFNKTCKNNWEIKDYNKNFRIYFPYQIMIDLTKENIVDKIATYINRIILNVPHISSVIFAGSVSKNNYVISMIEEALSNYKLEYYVCTYPSVAVVKGAVIFGLNPFIIRKRVSKYTIGIRCNEIWDELRHGEHPEKKFYDLDDNCYKCRDIFSPIIQKGQKILVDEINVRHYEIKCRKTTITFFKSFYLDIKYVDEKHIFYPKCSEFGNLTFDAGDNFDKNDRDLIIELKLGGTFISGNVKYKQKKEKIYFDFSDD